MALKTLFTLSALGGVLCAPASIIRQPQNLTAAIQLNATQRVKHLKLSPTKTMTLPTHVIRALVQNVERSVDTQIPIDWNAVGGGDFIKDFTDRH
jgi:hypothetical protein